MTLTVFLLHVLRYTTLVAGHHNPRGHPAGADWQAGI